MEQQEFDMEQFRQAWTRFSEAMEEVPPLSEEDVMRITRSVPRDLHKPSLLHALSVAASVVLVVVGVLLMLRPRVDVPSSVSPAQYAETSLPATLPANPSASYNATTSVSRMAVAKADPVAAFPLELAVTATQSTLSSQEQMSDYEEVVCDNWCETPEIMEELAYFCNNTTEGV